MKLNSQRLDADETAFFERELTSIEARLYMVLFPERSILSILKIDSSDGIGAEQFLYRIYESIGMAQILASYAAGDLPTADIVGSEFVGRFYSFANKFEITIQEIRAAAFANVPIEQFKADTAQLAHSQAWNNAVWFGDVNHNLQGILTHPNVTKGYVATVSGHTNWVYEGVANKTPDQINEDLSAPFRGIRSISKNVEMPNVLLMGIENFGYIADTMRSSVSDTSILEAFENRHPGLVVDSVPELDLVPFDPVTGDAGSGTNCFVYLDNNPVKSVIKGPMPFEMFPPAINGLQYDIACHSRFGGFMTRYPLSVSVAVGSDQT